jgi:hypothetical protein
LAAERRTEVCAAVADADLHDGEHGSVALGWL